MTYPLIFHPEAEEEYRKAYQWYEQAQQGLGTRFEVLVEQRLEQIARNPEHYHLSKAPYREVAIEIFPYSIIYKLNKKKKVIYISAIYHTRRHPRNKFR
jgi:plasmid stabilization system protein ParE